MKIAEIRQKTNDELNTEVKKIRVEHFNLRFRKVTDVIENPQLLRELRKDLARIYTVIREREISGHAQPTPAPAAKSAPATPAKHHAPKKRPVKKTRVQKRIHRAKVAKQAKKKTPGRPPAPKAKKAPSAKTGKDKKTAKKSN